MTWLYMPREVLRAYAEALPSLRSAETIAQVHASRVADAFRLKAASARLAQRRLQRDARGAVPARKANKAVLAGMGIGVREV